MPRVHCLATALLLVLVPELARALSVHTELEEPVRRVEYEVRSDGNIDLIRQSPSEDDYEYAYEYTYGYYYDYHGALGADASTNSITPVERYGQLTVQGNRVVGKDNQTVRLQGMSLFWSQWMGKYWNKDAVSWLMKDWKIEIIRAAMGVHETGYLSNPGPDKAKLETVVQAAIDLGIYVLIDWHLESSDPHLDKAKPFFAEMAEKYGKHPNVLFEPWNEPKYVEWGTIKKYHEEIVKVIRQHSSNICVLGNPNWSHEPDTAALDPVAGENIAYTVHFYAASTDAPGRIPAALAAGHAVIATEWGTCTNSGNGRVDAASAGKWMSYFEEHGISSMNWAVSDKDESCSALKGGASPSGGWSDGQLTESGRWVRNTIRGNGGTSTV